MNTGRTIVSLAVAAVLALGAGPALAATAAHDHAPAPAAAHDHGHAADAPAKKKAAPASDDATKTPAATAGVPRIKKAVKKPEKVEPPKEAEPVAPKLSLAPRKGRKHVLRVVTDILTVKPEGKGTDLSVGLTYLSQIAKRKAVTFLVSDFLARNRNMEVPEPGELLVVRDAGAYGFSMSSSYNLRPRAAEVLAQDGAFRLIRRRETFEDLVATETAD